MSLDWRRIRFTAHMTEAAAVVGECHVVFDFGMGDPVTYEVKVYEGLKGGGDERYFAVGTSRDHGRFQPVGSGDTPEEALQTCLDNAGVYHRRELKLGGE